MTKYTTTQFWFGVSLIIKNYHAINKQIFSCIIEKVNKISGNLAQQVENTLQHRHEQVSEIERQQGCIRESTVSGETEMFEILNEDSKENLEGFIVEMKLLKKNNEPDIKVIGVLNFLQESYSCYFDTMIYDDFCIRLDQGLITLQLLSNKMNSVKSEEWLEKNLKEKFIKWLDNSETNGSEVKVPSLSQVDVKRYNDLYKYLKKKYSQQALQLWSEAGESTDPLKFIYEDLAIAAYLISVWSNQDKILCKAPRAFADLGCGNGLLVYILTEEGYKGYGYDIRARKLWSFYPKEVKLIEAAVIPNNFKPPSDVDWLIGNHSDELSAWLPAMASLLSFDCCYFVLPCCAFEFSGRKYQRRDCKNSVYQDFLQYVEHVSNKCGFVTLKDRLKIPSTKRIALMGIKRVYTEPEYPAHRKETESFLQEEQVKYPNDSEEGGIKIRDKEEPVKNCTKVDPLIISKLVLQIFHLLLNCKENVVYDEQNCDSKWRPGGRLEMKDIVKSLNKEDLKQIKTECGGIKTLLRNKHEIFQFCDGNLIGLRQPQGMDSITSSKKPRTTKKRLCFFKEHHPDGCPLTDENCTFIH